MKTIKLSPFINRLEIKEIGKDTLYYVPARIIPALVGFLGIAIYTRLLNPHEYGLYVLVMTVVSTVYAFGFNWLGYVVWRYFERYKNDNNVSGFLSTIFSVAAAVFATVVLLGYTATIFLKGHMETHLIHLLRIGIVVLGVQIGCHLVLEILHVNRQGVKYSLYSSIMASGTLLLAILFLHVLALDVESILLATILVYGGIFSLEIGLIYKRWELKYRYTSKVIFKKILTFGMPQIGIAGGSLLLWMADRYMIGAFIGSKGVGIYAAGYTIAHMSIQMPLSILTLAAVPVIVATFENKGETETRILFRKLLAIYFLALTPVVFGIFALSREIVRFMLGELFWPTAVILPWVVAGVFFFGLSQIVNIPFQLKEKPHLLVYLIFPSAILNIVLNLFMIPRFGILGAAYSTLIAYFIYSIVSYQVVTRIFALSLPWLALGKSLVAAIGMYLTLHFVPGIFPPGIVFLIVKVGIGACCYFLILVLLMGQTFFRNLKVFSRYTKEEAKDQKG